MGPPLLGGKQALEQSALCCPGEQLLVEAGRALWVWREKQIEPETLPCAWDVHLPRKRGRVLPIFCVSLSGGTCPPAVLATQVSPRSSLCLPISPCSSPHWDSLSLQPGWSQARRQQTSLSASTKYH